MATRLTGAPVASKIYAQVREKAAALGTQPCLAAVSVGAQPDDRAYLRSIARSADGCGVAVRPVELPADCAADALTGTLRALSADDTVHGVLLLRPLPKALRAQHLLDALDPRKDVDGMTTASLGALLTGAAGFAPCTAEACLHLLELLAVIGGSDKAPAALALVYGEEKTCAEQGLDWTRAEQAYGDVAEGFDDLDDDGHDHGHDHGSFGDYPGYGAYSAN
ncbi:MAG: tetrahydrofolate dehydrogenase/cyclohydrolase catalytic domain-containing protein [Oscillospiraceae bacterium]